MDMIGVAGLILGSIMSHAQGASISVGGPGWAPLFDGKDDLIKLDAPLYFTNVTYMMWFHRTKIVDGNGKILSQEGNGCVLSGAIQGKDPRTGLPGGFTWKMAGGGYESASVSFQDDRFEANLRYWDTPYHFAASTNSTHVTLYLDGELFDSEAHGGVPYPEINQEMLAQELAWIAAGRPGTLGTLLGAGWLPQGANVVSQLAYGGFLDGVQMYDRALSLEEVREAMISSNAQVPDRYASYSFDDPLNDEPGTWPGMGQEGNTPLMMPSTMPMLGGPVAVDAQLGMAAMQVRICGSVSPPQDDVSAVATFTSSSTLGTILPQAGTPLPMSLVNESLQSLKEVRSLFCTDITFEATQSGFEHVPFSVDFTFPDTTVQTGTQNLSVLVNPNTPPTAGMAYAYEFDEGWLALGEFDPGPAHSLSFWAIWKTPALLCLGSFNADGDNNFAIGLWANRWLSLRNKQWSGGVGVFSNSVLTDSVENALPVHLFFVYACECTNCTAEGKDKATVSLYANGVLSAGPFDHFSCDNRIYWSTDTDLAPTDSLPMTFGNNFNEGSGFMHYTAVEADLWKGVADDIVYYNRDMPEDEIQRIAAGGAPKEEDVFLHWTFDADESLYCQSMFLWSKTPCYGLNEEQRKTRPTDIFPWSSNLIRNVHQVPSPFYKRLGSPMHVTLPMRSSASASCTEVELAAYDADGDQVTVSITNPSAADEFFPDDPVEKTLRVCPPVQAAEKYQEVSLQYNVCDSKGACSNAYSGLATATFHFLKRGPSVKAFQLLVTTRQLRLIFDGKTNRPAQSSASAIREFFAFSSSLVRVTSGLWLHDGLDLVLELSPDSDLVTGSWTEQSLADLAITVSINLKLAGGLRNADDDSYPSLGTSPKLQLFDKCAPGMYFDFHSTQCEFCPKGTVNDGIKETCQPCALGEVAEAEGSTSCTPCPSGTVSSSTGQAICEACSVGRSQPETGQSSCSPCVPGFYSDVEGAGACLPCGTGTFSSEYSATGCQSCDAPKVTKSQASSSSLDCACPQGSLLLADGSCAECPASRIADCKGVGGNQTIIAAMELFYLATPSGICHGHNGHSALDEMPIPYLCTSSSDCPGGLGPNCCPEGHAGLTCSLCASGYCRQGGTSCSKCSGITPIAIVIIASALIGTALFLLHNGSKKSGQVDVTRLQALSHPIVMGISFLQISLALSSSTTNFPPGVLTDVMPFFGFLNVDLAFFELDAAIPNDDGNGVGASFAKNFVALAFLLEIFLIVLLWSITQLLPQPTASEESAESRTMRVPFWAVLDAVGVASFTAFVPLSAVALNTFNCYSHPAGNNLTSLVENSALICWSDAYLALRFPIGMAALASVVGILAYFVFMVWKAPGMPEAVKRFKFLFAKFQPDSSSFAIAILLRNVWLALAPVFSVDNTTGGGCLIAAGLTIYICALSAKRPWKTKFLNMCDTAQNCGLLILTFGGVIFRYPTYLSPTDGSWGVASLIVTLTEFSIVPIVAVSAFLGHKFAADDTRQKMIDSFMEHLPEQWIATGLKVQAANLQDVKHNMQNVSPADIEQLVMSQKLMEGLVCGDSRAAEKLSRCLAAEPILLQAPQEGQTSDEAAEKPPSAGGSYL